METQIYYSSERNVQQLISLLKAHEVKKVVISPGTTNVCLVGSLQNDFYFELYSCVDERSAAYMACGLAEESEEPVVLSCTGATASRNYYPGLTEAFYRKLPVLAVTSTRSIGQVGQGIDQVTDRSHLPHDIVKKSFYVPIPTNDATEWENNVKINTALIDLRRRGGGPVHINIMTEYSPDFSVKNLPPERVIRYHSYKDNLPDFPGTKMGIFVGSHKKWSDNLRDSVERFCKTFNAPVLYEPGSNYHGEYGVPVGMLGLQESTLGLDRFDIIIHIGEIGVFGFGNTKEIWRVNIDGEVRDTFKKLTRIFELEEEYFFESYAKRSKHAITYKNMYSQYREKYEELLKIANTKELPFSNIWVAMETQKLLPEGAELHLGILNSARSWTTLDIIGGIMTLFVIRVDMELMVVFPLL